MLILDKLFRIRRKNHVWSYYYMENCLKIVVSKLLTAGFKFKVNILNREKKKFKSLLQAENILHFAMQ